MSQPTTDTDPGAIDGVDAIAELARERARRETLETQLLAEQRAKAGILEDLTALKPYKGLGAVEELQALVDERDARTDLQSDSSHDDGAGGAVVASSSDPAGEARRLEAAKAERQRERLRRQHQTELESQAQELREARESSEKLQAALDDRDISRILSEAALDKDTGQSILRLSLLPWLKQNLRTCFRKEADGQWTLTNPATEAPLRSPSGTGAAMTAAELLELARESPAGGTPWGDARLTDCFVSLGGGAGAGGNGGISHSKPATQMTADEKAAYSRKHGPQAFRVKARQDRAAQST